MKIAHVAVDVLRVPVDHPYVAGRRTVDANWHVLARIATSDGVEGIGYVPDAGGAIPKIDDAPWPGFPADLTPLALVPATQCEGTVLIHEKLFESRLFFVDSLIAMGARVVLTPIGR